MAAYQESAAQVGAALGSQGPPAQLGSHNPGWAPDDEVDVAVGWGDSDWDRTLAAVPAVVAHLASAVVAPGRLEEPWDPLKEAGIGVLVVVQVGFREGIGWTRYTSWSVTHFARDCTRGSLLISRIASAASDIAPFSRAWMNKTACRE